jgi:hypothetical protein
MNQRLKKSAAIQIGALIVMALAMITAPTPAWAKELASEAIASSVENGTFDQVRMALMMDMNTKQRFDFDEKGIEAVGRALLDQGRHDDAIEVLQLNQMISSKSAAAATALADAFRDSGNTTAARMYYQRALEIDPGNTHAANALRQDESEGGPEVKAAMAQMGIDPQALAAAGVTPEQIRQMEEAISRAQGMQAGGGMVEASTRAAPSGSSSGTQIKPTSNVTYESEFCEVLYKYNSGKKVSDPQIRARVEGEYGQKADADRRRSWNVETTCQEFLVAVPLWADVSPSVLSHTDGNRFSDPTGAAWDFEVGADGVATGVVMASADGTVTEMKRLGDPRSFN